MAVTKEALLPSVLGWRGLGATAFKGEGRRGAASTALIGERCCVAGAEWLGLWTQPGRPCLPLTQRAAVLSHCAPDPWLGSRQEFCRPDWSSQD